MTEQIPHDGKHKNKKPGVADWVMWQSIVLAAACVSFVVGALIAAI